MDLAAYARSLDETIGSIRKHLKTRGLSVRIYRAANGHIFSTEVEGTIWAARDGFIMHVEELFAVDPAGNVVDNNYRYRMLHGDRELIRFETDRNGFPAHAHFPPHYVSGNFRHYQVQNWPEHLQSIDFLIAYRFFADLVRDDGELPEHFRSAT
jgi:hypothetical protein